MASEINLLLVKYIYRKKQPIKKMDVIKKNLTTCFASETNGIELLGKWILL
jgi:hypothetical protein